MTDKKIFVLWISKNSNGEIFVQKVKVYVQNLSKEVKSKTTVKQQDLYSCVSQLLTDKFK